MISSTVTHTGANRIFSISGFNDSWVNLPEKHHGLLVSLFLLVEVVLFDIVLASVV